MAVNFKELGLVNTREMFKRAVNGGYAIPAFKTGSESCSERG